jgi:hypothetical protein
MVERALCDPNRANCLSVVRALDEVLAKEFQSTRPFGAVGSSAADAFEISDVLAGTAGLD